MAPVFDALAERQQPWVRTLLELPETRGRCHPIPLDLDLAFHCGKWGAKERGLAPPVSLLTWLLRNPRRLRRQSSTNADRAAVLRGDPETLTRALDQLRSRSVGRAWYLLEGKTFPDAVIETLLALIVVEGKRTEREPTTSTTWLSGRHQIWRHIDAAWECRGRRHVFGFFAVEGGQDGAIPDLWAGAAEDCLTPDVLASSFPHRSQAEIRAIANCFLGVTTWQRICSRFSLPERVLVPSL